MEAAVGALDDGGPGRPAGRASRLQQQEEKAQNSGETDSAEKPSLLENRDECEGIAQKSSLTNDL